jgi:membrane-bound lytic murein transglycosylase MltF
LLAGLLDGTGDIATGNLTITGRRSETVQFTAPFAANVKEVLATGPVAPPSATLEDLAGQEILVRASSSYFEHFEAINKAWESTGTPPIVLSPLDEDLEDEDVMVMVNAGLLPWAVVDQHKANLWAQVFTNIVVRYDVAIHQRGEVVWAVKDRPLLLSELNAFVKEHKGGTTFGNIVKKRYFGSDKFVKVQEPERGERDYRAVK